MADDNCHERHQSVALKDAYQQLEAIEHAQAAIAAGCMLATTGGRGVTVHECACLCLSVHVCACLSVCVCLLVCVSLCAAG